MKNKNKKESLTKKEKDFLKKMSNKIDRSSIVKVKLTKSKKVCFGDFVEKISLNSTKINHQIVNFVYSIPTKTWYSDEDLIESLNKKLGFNGKRQKNKT